MKDTHDQEVHQIHDNTDYLIVMIKALDDKFTMMLSEAEKRNGQRFDAQQMAVKTAMEAAEKAVNAAMAAAEKAVTKAEIASERRFESVNEFRKTLSDQTQTFLPRSEYIAQHQAIVEKVNLMVEEVSKLQNRQIGSKESTSAVHSLGYGIVITISALAAVAAVAITFFK